jgi:DNA gyrase/topoisomerase IV subunit B
LTSRATCQQQLQGPQEGRNGYGAKLANIFSTSFVVEICDGETMYKQEFTNNMKTIHAPCLKPVATLKKKKKAVVHYENGNGSGATTETVSVRAPKFTRITFYPEVSRFGILSLGDDDHVALMRKRTLDIAAIFGDVKVSFNGHCFKLSPKKSFEDYVEMHLDAICDKTDMMDSRSLVVPPMKEMMQGQDHETTGMSTTHVSRKRYNHVSFTLPNGWHICVASSGRQGTTRGASNFEQISFVNSVATTQGGTHVAIVKKFLKRMITEKLAQHAAF